MVGEDQSAEAADVNIPGLTVPDDIVDAPDVQGGDGTNLTLGMLTQVLLQILMTEGPSLPVLVGPFGKWALPTTITVTDDIRESTAEEGDGFRGLIINTGDWPNVIELGETAEEPAAPDNPAPEVG